MKLLSDSRKPLILAGLGADVALFRTFLQHRVWEAQGIPAGPIYYYFGSRHQAQEYFLVAPRQLPHGWLHRPFTGPDHILVSRYGRRFDPDRSRAKVL